MDVAPRPGVIATPASVRKTSAGNPHFGSQLLGGATSDPAGSFALENDAPGTSFAMARSVSFCSGVRRMESV
jgi:hypothetical protein